MYRKIIAVLVLLTAALAFLPTNQGKKVGDINEAIKKLESREAPELMEAVKAIALSDNDKAWEALRGALVKPETLKVLENKSPAGIEGAPVEEVYKDMAQFLKIIAEGSQPRAISTLIWLTNQKEYTEKKSDWWRQYLIYSSFKYVKLPTPELIKFLESKLKFRAVDGDSQIEIRKALAAYGSEESVKILEKDIGSSVDRILAMYRDRYVNVHLLLKRYQKATNEEYAHNMLRTLFEKTLPSLSKFQEPILLPDINPKGKEAQRFVKLFRDFLANPGNIPLSDDEKAKFKALIDKLEKEK